MGKIEIAQSSYVDMANAVISHAALQDSGDLLFSDTIAITQPHPLPNGREIIAELRLSGDVYIYLEYNEEDWGVETKITDVQGDIECSADVDGESCAVVIDKEKLFANIKDY